MTRITAMTATGPESKLTKQELSLGELGPKQVEIDVLACGLCHSDLSMIHNDWGLSKYPIIPGHEVVGKISAVGDHVDSLHKGQIVGLGWFSGSCMQCSPCMSGDHNMCDTVEQTIVARHGGFATKVHANQEWVIPLPDGLDVKKAGPLFCGGITVFNPIIQFGIKSTHKVGVIGIGGLGHLALKFLHHWGCEVTAFTSSPDKEDELRKLGAHHVLNSQDSEAMQDKAGYYDFILSTVNVSLDWATYMSLLGPRGRLHMVGAVLEPIPIAAFDLIMKQREVSGSGLGSPETTKQMLEFCMRHDILPETEHFKMSELNEAIAHLESGKARYRIVLENDLA